jgi:hypothetical protein
MLEGSLGGLIVDEKDTLGPSQVPEGGLSKALNEPSHIHSYPQQSRKISPGLSIISKIRIRLSGNLTGFWLEPGDVRHTTITNVSKVVHTENWHR